MVFLGPEESSRDFINAMDFWFHVELERLLNVINIADETESKTDKRQYALNVWMPVI